MMDMDHGPTEKCMLCNRGQLVHHTNHISFHQRTNRGPVFCCVIIPMNVCDHCGARSWDDRADAIMDDAVHREYEKLK